MYLTGENGIPGDKVLKFIVYSYLFACVPDGMQNRSHWMTEQRAWLLSNVHLMKILRNSGIAAYIRSQRVDENKWLPPGFRYAATSGTGHESQLREQRTKRAGVEPEAVRPEKKKKSRKASAANNSGDVGLWGTSGQSTPGTNPHKEENISNSQGSGSTSQTVQEHQPNRSTEEIRQHNLHEKVSTGRDYRVWKFILRH